MNIIVCIKQVPDTNLAIKVAPDGKDIDREGIAYVLNPYDEYALEEALKTKEKFGGSVTAISAGDEKATEILRLAVAMGADDAVLINDPAFAGSDILATARILAAAVATMQYDIIFAGKQAVDDDCAAVGPMVAELLKMPCASVVVKLEISQDGKKVTAHEEIEGATRVVELPLPCVITAQKGLNTPRYASLPGIMKAKKKEIIRLDNSKLNLDINTVGAQASKIKLQGLKSPPARSHGRILKGEPQDAARDLVRLLKEEAKVI